MKGFKKLFFIIPLLLFLFASNTMVANDMLQGEKALVTIKAELSKANVSSQGANSILQVQQGAVNSSSLSLNRKFLTVVYEIILEGVETNVAINKAYSKLTATKRSQSTYDALLLNARNNAIQLLEYRN